MPSPKRPLLRVVGHVGELAAVLLRAPHVDQRTPVLDLLEHIFPERADPLVVPLLLRAVARLGGPGRLPRQRTVLRLPLPAAAVHDPSVLVAEELEDPERIAGPPVVLVAVEDDGRVVRDPPLREELRERVLVQVVADERVLQVCVPVELHRSGDVPGLVQEHVLVRLHDPDLGVVEVFGDPRRRDEHLRVGVPASLDLLQDLCLRGHGRPPCATCAGETGDAATRKGSGP